MNYELRRSRKNKHLRLRVNEHGRVVVSAPILVPKIYIDRFVLQQELWITRQQQRLKLKKNAYPIFNSDQKLVTYLGRLYYYKFDNSIKERIQLTSNFITVNPVTGLEKDIHITLINWLKKSSAQYIHQSLTTHATRMELHYQKVSFRQQQSRWGSCSTRGNLNFNWRLIHFKPAIIDYVIIHELAHLRHHNHSRDFWNLVARYDPQYKTHISFLKKQVLTPVS